MAAVIMLLSVIAYSAWSINHRAVVQERTRAEAARIEAEREEALRRIALEQQAKARRIADEQRRIADEQRKAREAKQVAAYAHGEVVAREEHRKWCASWPNEQNCETFHCYWYDNACHGEELPKSTIGIPRYKDTQPARSSE